MSFVIEVPGARYRPQGTPMQPLRRLVEQVCSELPKPVNPATCTLKTKQGKLLNLDDPIRFANVPKGAVLLMESTDPNFPRLGVSSSQQHGSHQDLQPALAPSAPQATATSTGPDSALNNNDVGVNRNPAAPGAGPTPPADAPQQPSAEVPTPQEGALEFREQQLSDVPVEQRVHSVGPAPNVPVGADAGANADKDRGKLGSSAPKDPHTRQFVMFSKDALEKATEGAAPEDLPDSFFEITQSDLQRELGAQRRKHAYKEMGFRTRARREEEAAERAKKIGHASIRLMLPQGAIVQVEFEPLELLSTLKDFIETVMLKSEYVRCYSLFTTPPRRVLTNAHMQQTYWDLQMVPGAVVHLSIHPGAGQAADGEEELNVRNILRPEVLAAEGPMEAVLQKPRLEDEEATAASSRPTDSAAAFSVSQSSKVARSGGKVPKWFKM